MSQYRFVTAAVAVMLCAVPSLANTKLVNGNLDSANKKVYGTIRLDGVYDFHSKNKKDKDLNTNAQKIRLGLINVIPSETLGDITAKIELEAKNTGGNKDNTKGKSDLKIHEAYASFNNWLVGYTESTFIDHLASPEMINVDGPVGEPNHDVSRLNLIKYSTAFKGYDFEFAAEGSTTPLERKESFKNMTMYHREPAIVAAVTRKGDMGHVSVRYMSQYVGFHKELKNGGNHTYAAQLSGSVNIGAAKKDKVTLSIYNGNGLGIYGYDTDLTIKAPVADENRWQINRQVGWQMGYTHTWNDALRSNLIVTAVNNRDARFDGKNNKPNAHTFVIDKAKTTHDITVNTIMKLAKNVDLGAEYTYQKDRNSNKSSNIATKRSGEKAIVSLMVRI